jgi:hypothetical protein
MELGAFREITKDLPDDTYLVIMSTLDGDTRVIEDVSVNPYVDVVYIEASI